MPLYYLDIETNGIAKGRDGQILTIQTQKLEGGPAPLIVRRLWDYPNEKAMVQSFFKETNFWNQRWGLVPVGVNLDYDMGYLFDRGLRYGELDFGTQYLDARKPTLDLHDLFVMFNADRTHVPDGAYGNLPPMFYGTKLSNFSRKIGGGEKIGDLYKAGRLAAIDEYIHQEWRAFRELWDTLLATMPGVWRDLVAPKLGLAPKAI